MIASVFSRNKKLIIVLTFALFPVSFIGLAIFLNKAPKVEIITTTISNVAGGGHIIEGQNTALDSLTLQTDKKLIFESKEIETNSKTVNAAVLKWDEDSSTKSADDNYAQIQFRTNNGKEWSEWVDASDPEDRKDGTDVPHNALILADVIKNIQYRFVLNGAGGQPSPKIKLNDSSIELVDTSRGPKLEDANKKNLLQRAGSVFTPKKALAKADSPYIYNRAQWGSPEPFGSPEWDPTYEPLHRITVHHTASTETGDSFAAMRAVWHLHKNINGWGDIGYNYVVDTAGNMFQGRYYDYAEAERLKADVVGAHAYEHNRGTSGISVIGNFSTKSPPNEVFYSVARLAAYKAAPYDFNPADAAYFGPRLIGHRDVNQTACPGQAFYDRLQDIRNLVNVYYPVYNSMEHLDHLYIGQGFNGVEQSKSLIWPGTTGTAYIDVKNNGTETWTNNGFGATMLGTDSPRDRKSPFCSGTWLGPGCDRPSTFAKKVSIDASGNKTLQAVTEIKPGEIGRFEFEVTAPLSGGVYKEQYNLLSAQRSWFLQNKNIYFEFIVPPPTYAWQWQSQGIYTDDTASTPANLTNLHHNDRVYFEIKAKNTGNQPWLNAGVNPVRLATSRPQDRYSWLCDPSWTNKNDCNRAATLKETKIEPGQVGTFGFYGKIPYGGQSDKVIREFFNLTAESKSWLNDVGAYWEFTVKASP